MLSSAFFSSSYSVFFPSVIELFGGRRGKARRRRLPFLFPLPPRASLFLPEGETAAPAMRIQHQAKTWRITAGEDTPCPLRLLFPSLSRRKQQEKGDTGGAGRDRPRRPSLPPSPVPSLPFYDDRRRGGGDVRSQTTRVFRFPFPFPPHPLSSLLPTSPHWTRKNGGEFDNEEGGGAPSPSFFFPWKFFPPLLSVPRMREGNQ